MKRGGFKNLLYPPFFGSLFKLRCCTSQLKYVFWLENNVSCVNLSKLTNFLGRTKLPWTFDSHVIRSCTFETAANLYASASLGKWIIFYTVMAAKRFQTRTEDRIEQLLRDKSSKSTNKVLTFVIWINIYDLWLILCASYWDL